MKRFLITLAALAGMAGGLQAQPAGGAALTVASTGEGGQPLALQGLLWQPAGDVRGGLVLLHGAAGWNDAREGHYGRALSAAGFVVLAVDSNTARGVPQSMDHMRISFVQIALDALAAREVLVQRGIPADKIAVMGLSKGGTGAMYAADRYLLPQARARFTATVALYPPCHLRPKVQQPVGRLFLGLGEKDDLTGMKECQAVASRIAAAGGAVTVKTYPSSAHGFDGEPLDVQPFYAGRAESFKACDVEVQEDGREILAGKVYAPGGAEVIAAMRAGCVTRGASFWTNPAQKAAVTRDVTEFLKVALGN